MVERATDNRNTLVQIQPWVPNYKYYVGISVLVARKFVALEERVQISYV